MQQLDAPKKLEGALELGNASEPEKDWVVKVPRMLACIGYLEILNTPKRREGASSTQRLLIFIAWGAPLTFRGNLGTGGLPRA